MLTIPNSQLDLAQFAQEMVDECMGSSSDRGMIYTRATQYYYLGSYDVRACIFNKTKGFIDRLAGFLMQPTDVRFNIVFDRTEPNDVLERARVVAEKLSADFKQSDSDVIFADAVTWSLINGCQLIKALPKDQSFHLAPVHPQNFGVLSESILSLDEQEAFCHVTFPTVTRLKSMLLECNHPRAEEIINRVLEARQHEKDEEEPTYLHQMVVGGLQPLGNTGDAPSAAGIVQVFPVPTPWRPQRRFSPTVRFCELWVQDPDRENDWTTIQLIYPDIIIEGDYTRRNLSRIPGKHPFIKVQPSPTPGYFWGRSYIADVQMLQDVLNKRLRDLKVLWDRNVAAPKILSGFSSVTEEQYYKIITEGGFINDPNPNAKSAPLAEQVPPNATEEIEFILKLFDEAGGFSSIMGGQGEPGVRAGVHAQTLVRTSSPHLIDQASCIERQLAETGYLCVRLMQAMDPTVYETDDGIEFHLIDLPGAHLQVQVDSHSASPAFAEDNRQTAIALARAGAIDSEDLIHMLHPPGAELLLARLRERQKRQSEQAQQQEQKDMALTVLTGKPQHRQQGGRGGGRGGGR
jgi:hypothetical protein